MALTAGPFHSLGEGFHSQLPFCLPAYLFYCRGPYVRTLWTNFRRFYVIRSTFGVTVRIPFTYLRPNFLQKPQNFEPFLSTRLDGDHSKTAQFFGMPKQTYSAQMTGLSMS